MTDKAMPEIRLFESICMEHGTCWCAQNPYFTGHYPTKQKAAVAAVKRKRALQQKRRRDERVDEQYARPKEG